MAIIAREHGDDWRIGIRRQLDDALVHGVILITMSAEGSSIVTSAGTFRDIAALREALLAIVERLEE